MHRDASNSSPRLSEAKSASADPFGPRATLRCLVATTPQDLDQLVRRFPLPRSDGGDPVAKVGLVDDTLNDAALRWPPLLDLDAVQMRPRSIR
jgi:hypothetical protein